MWAYCDSEIKNAQKQGLEDTIKEFTDVSYLASALLKKSEKMEEKVCIYCPIGQYKDLLVYLMRRLLENGANTLFINMIKSKDITLENVLAHPTKIVETELAGAKWLVESIRDFWL
ncbi:MAG: proline dehydrogenase family protein [Candidatus Midichloria sp.]|nr:MAG: proline dehydrogenase family protein [Candidatus Midichloria sp.]